MRSTKRLKFLIRADFSFNGSVLAWVRYGWAPASSQSGGNREQANKAPWEEGDVGSGDVNHPGDESVGSGIENAVHVCEVGGAGEPRRQLLRDSFRRPGQVG